MTLGIDLQPTVALAAAGLAGGAGVFAAALALGMRHGIDWDHIAAITDITSTTAAVDEVDESWLMGEPGLLLTDESHHSRHDHHDGGHVHPSEERRDEIAPASAGPSGGTARAVEERPARSAVGVPRVATNLLRDHKKALLFGTLYALGHATVVTLLGLLALLAREILPSWIDPVMERVVGVTLVFLALYLFYSVYRYFRAGGEFRIRSRWMLIFAGVRNAWHWSLSRIGNHEHEHVAPQAYGARTSYAIGLIHGIGAETGTQVLIIATAVGAGSKAMGVAALLFFVLGLLIANSFVTVASTAGFVSVRRRQAIYVGAGVLAAVFSLIVGLAFLGAVTTLLPDLDPYFRWIGGPS